MRGMKPVLVGMEACGGAHEIARELLAMGHEVKLMPPQYVKPYVKTNKNDTADAEGCSEAVTRPTMRFVEVKTPEQQAYTQLLLVRDRLIRQRTGLANQIHGFLHEVGVRVSKGVDRMIRHVVEALEEHGQKVPSLTRELVDGLVEELHFFNKKIDALDKEIASIAKNHAECSRLVTIPGIGPVTALAIVAMVGNVTRFKNGREFAAYLGLVPRQMSSASRERLGGISKRGNPFIRKLLVQGAQSIAAHAHKINSRRTKWFTEVKGRRGHCKAVVALANKNARTVWCLLARGEQYKAGHVPDYRGNKKTMVVQ
jgi:transposase